jgi:hypothetical protein
VGCSDEGVAGYLAQLLGAIEARSLLPPLVVLGILAKNTSLKVGGGEGWGAGKGLCMLVVRWAWERMGWDWVGVR